MCLYWIAIYCLARWRGLFLGFDSGKDVACCLARGLARVHLACFQFAILVALLAVEESTYLLVL